MIFLRKIKKISDDTLKKVIKPIIVKKIPKGK